MQSAKVSTSPHMENAPTIIEFQDLAAGRSLSSPYTPRPLQMFLPRTSNLRPGPEMVRAIFVGYNDKENKKAARKDGLVSAQKMPV